MTAHKLLPRVRNRIRRLVRLSGWDVVRYRPPSPPASSPLWPTLLGAANLPIRTVLDIGAKDGDTARIFRRYFPEAVIHCFEPHPQSFQSLATWAATQVQSVYCYPFALGDRTGEAQLYTSGSRLAVASLLPPAPRRLADSDYMRALTTQPVELRRLDDVVANLTLADELLVKIDTEGFDKQVILGGRTVLQRAAACIVEVHVWERYDSQPTFCELINMMEATGMRYAGTLHQCRKATGEVTYFDALFIRKRTDADCSKISAA